MAQDKMKRVLCVEDDRDSGEILKFLLLDEDYEVFFADNVHEALRLTSAEKFDLIVLDELLPDGSGSELARAIRTSDAKVPIVFYSACAYPNDAARAFSAGAQVYLTKPSDFSDLVKIINNLLEPDLGAIKSRQVLWAE